LGCPAHDFVAIKRAGAPPNGKTALGGSGHFFEVGGFGTGHLANHVTRGGVKHWQAAGGGTVAPVTVNEKLDVGIVGHKNREKCL
jgi:hypothetical protein